MLISPLSAQCPASEQRSVLRPSIRMQYFKSDTLNVPNAKSPASPPGFDFNVKHR
jgi:hypothetical protein